MAQTPITQAYDSISQAYDELDYQNFLARTGKPDTPQSLDEFCQLREALAQLLVNDKNTFAKLFNF